MWYSVYAFLNIIYVSIYICFWQLDLICAYTITVTHIINYATKLYYVYIILETIALIIKVPSFPYRALVPIKGSPAGPVEGHIPVDLAMGNVYILLIIFKDMIKYH